MANVNQRGIMSEAKLGRIEKGRAGAVKAGDVWELLRFYDVHDKKTIDAMTAMAEATSTTGYEEFSAAVPDWFDTYLGLEATCAHLGSYHPELAHGLLQTDAYARAAIIAGDPDVTEEEISSRLKLRAERRRAALERIDRTMTFILGPGTFDLIVGDTDVMAAQVEHLKQMSARDGISIRVVSPDAGVHAGVRGPFTILDFADPEDPSVVYLESLAGARYIEEVRHLTLYRRAFTALQSQSRPIKEY